MNNAPPHQALNARPHQLAQWSLYAALGSLLCCGASGPVGAVLGYLAHREIARSPGQYSNAGSAIAGMVLGGGQFVLFVVAATIGSLMPDDAGPPPSASTSASAGASATAIAPPSGPIGDSAEGATVAAPEQDLTEAKATALRILRDTETLLRQGKAMEPLRTSAGTSALARCGQLMRERQPKAESLRDESMKLPLAIRANLAAPGHAVLCVSCLKDANDYCQMGEQNLKAGRAALSEM